MEGFIDKLADFLRSLMGDDKGAAQPRATRHDSTRFRDPDLQNAWEELDDYMRGGTGETTKGKPGGSSGQPRRVADETLRPDYKVLEVPFGSDIETVRRSYKSLMLKYHPDRNSQDPEKQRISLEITKKINESFERIRSRHEGRA